MDISPSQETVSKPYTPVKYKTNLKLSKLLNYQHKPKDLSTDIPELAYSLKQSEYTVRKPYLLCHPILRERIHDPYLELLYQKHEFNMKVDYMRSYYRKNMKSKLFNIDKLDYYNDMQQLLDTNPDKYFNCNYNWYYSGGNIDAANLSNQVLLFHATEGKNLSVAGIIKNSIHWELEHKKTLLKTTNNIFEIKCILKNNDLLLGVRSKKEFQLYNVSQFNNPEISCELLKQDQSSIPYVAFCLDPYKLEQFLILNAQQKVKVWDLHKNKSRHFKISKIINTTGENWAQIKFLDNNTVIYVNNISYNFTDIRSDSVVNTILSKELLGNKEKFTNMCIDGESSNYFYLMSDHNALQIDKRMHNVVSKWTHLLKGSIYLSECVKTRSENLVCVASRYPAERLLFNHKEDTISIPTIFSTLGESLDECLSYKPTIEMSHFIRKRITLSTTGIKLITHNNDISLVAVNSVGDVSVNDIQNTSININESTMKRNLFQFSKFGQELLEQIEPLHFSDKVIVKDLNSVLVKDKPDLEDYLAKEKKRAISRVKRRLQKKTAACKTSLSTAWDLPTTIEDIEEIDTSVNVQLWLSRISEGVDKTNDEFNNSIDAQNNVIDEHNNSKLYIDNSNLSLNNSIQNINSQKSVFGNFDDMSNDGIV